MFSPVYSHIIHFTELIVTESEAVQSDHEDDASASIAASSSAEDEPTLPMKVPRLMAKYKTHRARRRSRETTSSSARAQMRKYMEHVQEIEEQEGLLSTLQYWSHHSGKYPSISKLAMTVLTVPASSAPVERVFSHGGIIMRPHRARISSKLLEMLMFLKCNENVSFFK